MAEQLRVTATDKAGRYAELLPQVTALVAGEQDQLANMANVCAALKYGMGFFWVGFYLVKDGMLVLGPFQGPVACTRIEKGRGVCGTSWQQGATLIVKDVDAFPGHIACSAESKSEIVVPLKQQGRVVGVFDVDSAEPAAFDETDQHYLELIVGLLGFNQQDT